MVLSNKNKFLHLFLYFFIFNINFISFPPTHRADVDESQRKREASALVRMWTAHTSLTIRRAQYMLYHRMLQYIVLPISEEPPHAIRTPDEDVENLVRACLPFVESGMFEFFPITLD